MVIMNFQMNSHLLLLRILFLFMYFVMNVNFSSFYVFNILHSRKNYLHSIMILKMFCNF